MIECQKLCKRFGEQAVLTDFSAVFEQGKHYCITGASGCGKTTLLRIIGGLLKADSGSMLLPEKTVFSWVFQENRLLEGKTAAENLHWVAPTCSMQQCEELLLEMGIPKASLQQPVRAFSGGMKRRVALARCLLFPGTVLLLDEPYKGLDTETRDRVHAVVEKYTAQKTVLMISHEEILPQGYREVSMTGKTHRSEKQDIMA